MSRTIKTSALISALVLLLACFSAPVYASSPVVYYPPDYVVSVTTSGDNALYKFVIPCEALFKTTQYNGSTPETWSEYGHLEFDNSSFFSRAIFQVYPLGVSPVSNQNLVGGGLDIRDFKENAWLTVRTTFDLSIDYAWTAFSAEPYVWTVNLASRYYYYDRNGNFISEQRQTFAPNIVTLNYNDGVGTIYSDMVLFDSSIYLEIPENAVYLVPCFQFYMELPASHAPVSILGFQSTTVDSFSFECNKNMLVDQSETLHQIEEALGDTNDKLDQIIEQPEQEKQEANDAGQSAVEEFISAIPDESQGFMDALLRLEEIFNYDGTEATLTFPAITLPEIPGVMSSYRLSDEYEVDFEFWASQIPVNVMTAVQSILTLALIAFCYKEFYDVLSFVVSLRGGD